VADFCKACSIELFGEDLRELASLGHGTPLPAGHGYSVICEGCGFIMVDEEGNCVMCDLRPGWPGHGPARFAPQEQAEFKSRLKAAIPKRIIGKEKRL